MDIGVKNYIRNMFAMTTTPTWDASYEGTMFYDKTAKRWITGNDTGWQILDRSTTLLANEINAIRWIDAFEYPTDESIHNTYTTTSGLDISVTTDLTTYGNYALKATAVISGSENATISRNFNPALNFSDEDYMRFDIRSSVEGSNLQLQVYNKKEFDITIDHTKIDEPLIDFPLPIELTDEELFSILSEDEEPTKKFKIEYTNVSGTTQCPIEIECWDVSNNKALIHTKVPYISSTEDTILKLTVDEFMDENTTYIGEAASSASQNVWTSNYKAVLNMAQDPSDGANCIKDSTSNANHGTPAGTMLTEDLIDGSIGKAVDTDGTDDRIEITDTDDFYVGTGDASLIISFKRSRIGTVEFVCGQVDSGLSTTSRNFMIQMEANNTLYIFQGYNTSQSFYFQPELSISDTDLHQVMLIRDGNTLSVYLDNVVGATTQDVTGLDFVNSSSCFSIGRVGEYAANYTQAKIEQFIFIKGHALTSAERKAWYEGRLNNLVTAAESPITDREVSINSKLLSHNIHINRANIYQSEFLNISTISGSYNTLKFKVLNDNLDNTFYIDNMYFGIGQIDWVDAFEYPTDTILRNNYVTTSSGLTVYSEDSLITYGDYALKAVATISGSKDEAITKVFDPTMNFSNKNYLNFDIRSSRVGETLQLRLTSNLMDWEQAARFKITIDHTKIDENLTHYPLSLVLGANQSQIFDAVGNNWKKIAITEENNTQLYIEKEQWTIGSETDYVGSTENMTQCTAVPIYNSSYDGEKAFNGDGCTSRWLGIHDGDETGGACYIEWNFGTVKKITQVRMQASAASDDQFPENVEIYGSSTGMFAGEETLLHTGTFSLPIGGAFCDWMSLSDPENFQYLRIEVHTIQDPVGSGTTNYVNVCEVEFKEVGSSKALLHVSRDSFVISNTKDTILYLYYDNDHEDNDGYVGEAGSSAGQEVWNSNYKAVYNLAQDPSGGTSCILDSTSNVNHGTPSGTMLTEDLIDGSIGKALEFDGTDDYIDCGDSSNFDVSDFTLETYVEAKTVSADSFIVGCFDDGVSDGYALRRMQTTNYFRGTYNDAGANLITIDSAAYTAGMYLATMTFKVGTGLEAFIDGVSIGTDSTITTAQNPFTQGFFIGAQDYATKRCFSGKIEMVKLANTVRSDAWIKTNYYNRTDNLTSYELDNTIKGYVTHDININALDTYQTEAVNVYKLDSVEYITFKVINDDLDNIFYVDNMHFSQLKQFTWIDSFEYPTNEIIRNNYITTSSGLGDFTAKSVILDITDCYGLTDYMGIRSVEFVKESNVISIASEDISCYATSSHGAAFTPDKTFITSLSKIGSFTNLQWLSGYTLSTNQRLIIVFDTELMFDSIIINNSHSSGIDTDQGAKNVKIHISSDSITSTVHDEIINNSTLIFNSVLDEHVASDEVDDQTLTLQNQPVITNLTVYSEDSLITYGDYALKAVATISGSKDEAITKVFDPTMNFSNKNYLNFDIRSSRVGETLQLLILSDSGDIVHNISIDNLNTYETKSISITDLTTVSGISFKILNDDLDNTFYIDNMYSE